MSHLWGIAQTKDVPPTLKDTILFDFVKKVKTKLWVLLIRDSVVQQFLDPFNDSLGICTSWVSQDKLFVDGVGHSKLFWGKGGVKEMSMSLPTRGSEVTANWRITDFGQKQTRENLFLNHTVLDEIIMKSS